MASPTYAEAWDQLTKAIHLLETTREMAESNAQNWVGQEDTFMQALESDYAAEAAAAVASARARLDGVLREAPNLLTPHLLTLGKVINSPARDPQTILTDLYDYMITNTKKITSRAFSYGSVSAGGSNAGDGTVQRLTVDEQNLGLEACHADVKTLDCIADHSSGAEKHEELFRIYGQAAGKDALSISGSGRTATIAAVSARDSLVNNPSFSRFSGTTSVPTAITDWTSSITVNGTNYDLDGTNYYRDFSGDTTPYALNIKASGNLTQKLSVRRTQLNPDVPYYCQIAWNRTVGSATGTLVLRMGGHNASVSVSAQSGWQILRVAVGQNSWFKNFDEQDLDIAIEWTETGGTGLLLDDVIFVPMVPFDGLWYLPVGAATPFLRDDTFTFTDTATESVLQRWFWRAFGRYLPHTTGSLVTESDP